MHIDPTAHVDPTAQVDPTARLSPGCFVGPNAVIGPGCVLHPYAIVGPHTELGAACHVYSFAVVGADAQDRHTPPGSATRLICGPENIFREQVTVSRGSLHGGAETRLGAGNLLMVGVHVGHDARLGSGITLANNVSLAGHVEVADRASLGGHAAVHQFTRVGTLAFVAANAMVSQDVPPYCLAAGDHARLFGLNVTGLKRAGFDTTRRRALHRAFRLLLGDERLPGQNQALDPRLAALLGHAEVRTLFEFLQDSPRGICRAVRIRVGSSLQPREPVDSPGRP